MSTTTPKMDAAARRKWEIAKLAKLAMVDPWYFITNFCFTQDEHDPTQMAKLFPRKLYIRVLIRAALEHEVLFIEKSRQIMATWTFAALAVWDVLTKKNRRGCFQSTKDDTASALLKRAQVIYLNLWNKQGHDDGFPIDVPGISIPEVKWNKAWPGTTTEMEFPETGGLIMAVPQGADVFTSYTFSWVLADEVSKQKQASKSYSDAMPTLQDGSHWWGPGTANGKVWNWMKLYGWDPNLGDFRGTRIVDSANIPIKKYTEEELLAMPSEQFNAIPFMELIACIPGMRYWIVKMDDEKTPCLRIHYSADPAKRPGTPKGDEWFARERQRYSATQWAVQMEIKYDVFEGRKVISNWSDRVFVRDELPYHPKYHMFIPVDFGSRLCGAIFLQKVQLESYNFYQARLYAESILRRPAANTFTLAESIIEILKHLFPEIWNSGNFACYPDPAGNIQTDTTSDKSLNTNIKILEAHGLPCHSKKFGIPESTQLVETIFHRSSPGGDPGILIHTRCDYMKGVLGGGWHYPDKPAGMDDGKPEKDGEWDHGGDLARYGIAHMFEDMLDLVDGPRRAEIVPVQQVFQKYTGRPIGHYDPAAAYQKKLRLRGRH